MARSWDTGTGQPGRHEAYRSAAVTVLIDAEKGSTGGCAVTGGDGGLVAVTAAGSGGAVVVGAVVVGAVVLGVVVVVLLPAVVDVELLVEVVVVALSAVTPSELAQAARAATASSMAPAVWWTRPQSIP